MSNRQERRADERAEKKEESIYTTREPGRMRNIFVLFIVALFTAATVIPGIIAISESRNDEIDPLAVQQLIASRRQRCQANAQAVTNTDLAVPAATPIEGAVTELVIEDIQEGDGATVESGNCIVINYHGNLSGGLVFDSSYERDNPFATIIGEGNVIPGWDEGLIGMKIGGIRRITIPAEQAYGAAGSGVRDFQGNLSKSTIDPEQDIDPAAEVDADADGRSDYIPENAPLVFYLELLDIHDVGPLPQLEGDSQ